MEQSELSRQFIEVIPRTMRSIRTEMRAAAQSEFTLPQFRVMAQIHFRPKTNSELAESIGMSVPAMSRLVDGLVKKKLIKRIQSTKDRRQVSLTLSPLGRRKYESLRSATQVKFTKKFENLPPEQRSSLQLGLLILSEIFQ